MPIKQQKKLLSRKIPVKSIRTQYKKVSPKIIRAIWDKKAYVSLFAILIIFISIHAYTTPTSVTASNTNIRNKTDTRIAQYSDTHITPNAILTDQNLASSFMLHDNLAALVTSTTNNQPSTGIKTVSPAKEYGTWLWTSPRDMTDDYIQSVLSGAQSNGIHTIYVSVDTYLDIFTLPDGPEKTKKEKDFSAALEHFITLAHQKNITVDAEAGWRNWAQPDNLYKPFAIINYIKNFNVTHTEKLRGFQYDIEPYLLPEYVTDEQSVLRNYLSLIDQTITHFNGSDLQFSVVIPDFYDDVSKETVPVTYNGTTAYTYTHILTMLERRSGSTIIIMAYRNFATGENGSIDVSHTEVTEASSGNFHTKIIIAQETGDVQPAYITFNNTSKKYFTTQVNTIQSTFQSYTNFGGIAVHYVNAFMQLN